MNCEKEKFIVSFIWQHHAPILWWPKIFNCRKIGDQNPFLVTNCNGGNLNVTKDFLVFVLTDMIDVLEWMLTWHLIQNGHVTSILTTLLPLCIVIENIFSPHNIGDWILNFEFFCHIIRWLNIFDHQLSITTINDQKISICSKIIWELPKSIQSFDQYWPLIRWLKCFLSLFKNLHSLFEIFNC